MDTVAWLCAELETLPLAQVRMQAWQLLLWTFLRGGCRGGRRPLRQRLQHGPDILRPAHQMLHQQLTRATDVAGGTARVREPRPLGTECVLSSKLLCSSVKPRVLDQPVRWSKTSTFRRMSRPWCLGQQI